MQSGQQVIVEAFGETPMEAIAEHLTIVEQQPPERADLGPADVIVAVKSCAVGWVDLLMTSGQYQHMAKPPYCPGLEYSGEVVAVGSEVQNLRPGARVLSDGFFTGPRSLGPYQRWGGFANYAVAPERALIRLPTSWSFDQGCSFLSSYETAFYCLLTCGRLQAGETVVIHGASGATGLAAVHIAKLVGATVIATGRSPDKLAQVKAHGADHVCAVDETFRDRVKALTEGRGADVIYDGVGGAVTVPSLRCARFGARYLIVGWASTPFVAKGKGGRGAPNANLMPTNLVLMKGLRVLGCPTAIATHRTPEIREPRLTQLLEWVESKGLQPHVDRVFELANVVEALKAKWRSEAVGGIVLRP